MTARDDILSRLKKAVPQASLTAVDQRMALGGRGTIPQRGQGNTAQQRDLFQAQAEALSASVVRVKNLDDVPEAVATYLTQHNLSTAIRRSQDPILEQAPWSKAPMLTIETGKAQGSDEVSVTSAAAGVAETGTLVARSGRDHPTTLNFLPENHVIVLPASRLVGDYETAVAKIRADLPEGTLPRTINFITGPSRTADIEQKIELGAHGPRRLHIILVEDA